MTQLGQMGTQSDDETETDPYVRHEGVNPYVHEGVIQDLMREMD